MTTLSPEPNRVITLQSIALCLTPRQWFEWFGFGNTLDILEEIRVQKNRDVVAGRDQYQEPTWFEPVPVGYGTLGEPLYAHQLGDGND